MQDLCTRGPFTYVARKLYEFPAVTKVDGLPQAPSTQAFKRPTHCFTRACQRLQSSFWAHHTSGMGVACATKSSRYPGFGRDRFNMNFDVELKLVVRARGPEVEFEV